MPILNLVTPPYAADDVERGDTASQLIDGIITDKRSLTHRPGLHKYGTTAQVLPVQGIYWWSAKSLLIVVCGGKVFKSTGNGAFTDITGSFPVHATNTATFASNEYWLYIATGGKIHRTDGTTSYEEASPAPATCTHVAYIDGMVVANLSGSQRWYYAEPDGGDVTAALIWAATGLTAEGSPDNLQAVGVGWREVVLVGKDSTEIWYNQGGTTVFARLEGAFIEQGTIAPYSLVKADNTWFFLNQNRQVVRLNGRTPSVISAGIQNELDEVRVPSDGVGYIVDKYYVLRFKTEGICFVYDMAKQVWYKWGKWNATDVKYDNFLGTCAAWSDKHHVWFVGGSDAKVYLHERTLYYDDRDVIRTKFVSKPVDFDTFEEKTSKALTVKLKRGGGTIAESFAYALDEMYTNHTAHSGVYYEYQYDDVTILGSKNWTWAVTNLPSGFTFTPATRTISGTNNGSALTEKITEMAFNSAGVGVMFGTTSGKCYRTIDYGDSWAEVGVVIAGSTSIIGAVYSTSLGFCVVTGDGKVATSPSGLVWTEQTVTDGVTTLNYARGIGTDGSNVYITDFYIAVFNKIRVWRGNGSGWTKVGPLASDETTAPAVAWLTGTTWLIGTGGPDAQIHKSTDSFDHWSTVKTFASGTVQSIDHDGAGFVTAVADSTAGIWWSDDYGDTWTRATGVGLPTHNYTNLYTGTCWLTAGDQGIIARSTDGKAYTVVHSGGDDNLTHLEVQDGRIFACGDDPDFLLVSDDDGLTWTSFVNCLTTHTTITVAVTDAATGLVVKATGDFEVTA